MLPESRFARTRLAPTPSGYLHAGNALNFLLTAALAGQTGAAVLLRIDDLDRERYRTAYAADVFETLRFLHISWNEGPQSVAEFEASWSQQQRMPLYQSALQMLAQRGAVFACTCSRMQSSHCSCAQKQLPLDTPGASWRLLTNEEAIAVQMLDGEMRREVLPALMKNFVVRKKDGYPAYQLSSLVDDLHFSVDLIVRGEDLWPSTLAQQFLAQCLGEERFTKICFYHHPLLKGGHGEKLSKSAGDTSVKHWREGGRPAVELVASIGRLLQLPEPVTDANGLLQALNRTMHRPH